MYKYNQKHKTKKYNQYIFCAMFVVVIFGHMKIIEA